MADAIVELAGPDEIPVIAQMYNQIFRPARDADSIRRRFRGRYNILQLIARLKDQPVGFFMGFELKPTVYFAWFYGVLPDFRRQGVASQLMEAVHGWALQHEYESVRMECLNQHRPMLHLAISHEYDMVGLRWDPGCSDNLVIFEKLLAD
jgi:GNAT superfamily N-acetyltransferase